MVSKLSLLAVVISGAAFGQTISPTQIQCPTVSGRIPVAIGPTATGGFNRFACVSLDPAYFTYNSGSNTLSLSGVTSNSITSITGDASSSNYTNGNVTLTLANVLSTPGTFGSSTTVPQVTYNAKGLLTAVTNTSINFPVTSISLNSVSQAGPAVNLIVPTYTSGTNILLTSISGGYRISTNVAANLTCVGTDSSGNFISGTGCSGGGSGVTLQTNGASNGSQSLLNITGVSGSGMTASNTAGTTSLQQYYRSTYAASAASRPIINKDGDFFSVLDQVGVVGDGSNDDTAGLNSVISTARSLHRCVIFPDGYNYKINGSLNLASLDCLKGGGGGLNGGRTLITQTNIAAATFRTSPHTDGGYDSDIDIRGFTIIGGKNCVNIDQGYNTEIHDITCNSWSGSALNVVSWERGEITNLNCYTQSAPAFSCISVGFATSVNSASYPSDGSVIEFMDRVTGDYITNLPGGTAGNTIQHMIYSHAGSNDGTAIAGGSSWSESNFTNMTVFGAGSTVGACGTTDCFHFERVIDTTFDGFSIDGTGTPSSTPSAIFHIAAESAHVKILHLSPGKTLNYFNYGLQIDKDCLGCSLEQSEIGGAGDTGFISYYGNVGIYLANNQAAELTGIDVTGSVVMASGSPTWQDHFNCYQCHINHTSGDDGAAVEQIQDGRDKVIALAGDNVGSAATNGAFRVNFSSGSGNKVNTFAVSRTSAVFNVPLTLNGNLSTSGNGYFSGTLGISGNLTATGSINYIGSSSGGAGGVVFNTNPISGDTTSSIRSQYGYNQFGYGSLIHFIPTFFRPSVICDQGYQGGTGGCGFAYDNTHLGYIGMDIGWNMIFQSNNSVVSAMQTFAYFKSFTSTGMTSPLLVLNDTGGSKVTGGISTGTTSNTDMAGSFALGASSTTATYTFAGVHPARPTCGGYFYGSNPGTGNNIWTTFTTSGGNYVTVTFNLQAAVSGGINIDYHCDFHDN